MHVMVMVGTRPEAVKMAPVIRCLKGEPMMRTTVCASGQHQEMLSQAFRDFGIEPDINLEAMSNSQSLATLSAALFQKFDDFLEQTDPDWLLVQGDTTSVMVAGLCAFYRNIKVGHVEGGLRSFEKRSPFPEEVNRKIAASISDLHFAPTEAAKRNLLGEGVAAKDIIVTGNTVVDALHMRLIEQQETRAPGSLGKIYSSGKRIILVTAHRRENHGQPLLQICQSIKKAAKKRPDLCFVYPVHLNPAVNRPVREQLGGVDNIELLDPLPYPQLLGLMEKAEIILTDSGGIQEEATVLGKPVLVLRENTVRMEGVEAGAAVLVGADEFKIESWLERLLDDRACAAKMSACAGSVYGDGHAAERIVSVLRDQAGS